MADFFKKCLCPHIEKYAPIFVAMALSGVIGFCSKMRLTAFTGEVGNLVLLAIVFITFIISKYATAKVSQSDFWCAMALGADFITIATLSLYIDFSYYNAYPYFVPLMLSVMTFICISLLLNPFGSSKNIMPLTDNKKQYEKFEKIADDTNVIINKDDYYRLFNVNKNKSRESLREAIDIRKFEIELYWKRATYFWTLIAAIFVGFFTAYASQNGYRSDLLVILCCLGVVFSFAWVLVNKGSKYWQENWERHVDFLENDHIGPLYKVYFSENSSVPFSVSKINELVSIFVCILWVILLIKVQWPIHSGVELNMFYFILSFSAIGICVILYGMARSRFAGKEQIIRIRSED